MSSTGEQFYGPYPHRAGWRVVVLGPPGSGHDGGRSRTARQCATEAEARALLDTLRAQASARTVEVAIEEYVQYLESKGNRPRSIETTERRFRAFLSEVVDGPLSALSPARAVQLYAAYAQGHAADTHRNTLGQLRTFGRWCLKQGWTRSNPWESVEPVGRRRRGKRQMRLDEARKLWAHLVPRLETDLSALAVATVLRCGLRTSELVSLTAGDLDDGGRLLWIDHSKTEAGERRVKVPAAIGKHLVRLASTSERLFPRHPQWVRWAALRHCELAGVPKVNAHGLRGLHATLRVLLGDLARDLGHTHEDVTSGHYIAPGTIEDATVDRVSELFTALSPEVKKPDKRPEV